MGEMRGQKTSSQELEQQEKRLPGEKNDKRRRYKENREKERKTEKYGQSSSEKDNWKAPHDQRRRWGS